MEGAALPLRDIHLPLEPGWWPPAPGVWLLGLVALLLLAGVLRAVVRTLRRARRRRMALDALARILHAHPPALQPVAHLAAASELLRRLCRRHAPQALLLRDEAWLAFLDGADPARPFSLGPGRLLLDGPFRAALPAAEVEALQPLLRDLVARLAGDGDA